jgi:hypothetical protein
MSGEPAFEPEHVVAALNAAGVAYIIVGGLALGAHGVVRSLTTRSGWQRRSTRSAPARLL